jgi:hypothetical protein
MRYHNTLFTDCLITLTSFLHTQYHVFAHVNRKHFTMNVLLHKSQTDIEHCCFDYLNTHAPLHRSNTCFIVHFRYWESSDQISQWIPFTSVIDTSLTTCTYKGNS